MDQQPLLLVCRWLCTIAVSVWKSSGSIQRIEHAGNEYNAGKTKVL